MCVLGVSSLDIPEVHEMQNAGPTHMEWIKVYFNETVR